MKIGNRKHSIKLYFFLLVCAICSIGNAQEVVDNAGLVGNWTISESATFAFVDNDIQQELQADAEFKQRFDSSYLNRRLQINADGSFIQTGSRGNKVEGLWELKGPLFILTDKSGYAWPQRVIHYDGTQLTLQQLPNGNAKPLISQLVFIKQ